MYEASFRRDKNGVHILSKYEMDSVAENYISDFCPEAMMNPMTIDIDSFAQNYLGLTQDFQYLSHDGRYLGMMVFDDTNKVPVYNPNTNNAEYIHANARTVIIDNALLDENQENRYRFTMGHESGHAIFHTEYFYRKNKSQLQNQPMIQCRDISLEDSLNPKLWDDNNWMEWQANYMSAALLMPKSMIEKLAHDCKDSMTFTQFIIVIIDTFNVSVIAACRRLEALGLSKCFLTRINDFVSIREILVQEKIHQIYR